jgi:tRNA threonylcarbamoyladenosine biosynthesis protein TsaE
MKAIHFLSKNYDETLAFAAKFSKMLKRGDIVCLFGELGSGKTAFVKGLAQGLKIDPTHVHSPTFTLMNVYEGKIPLYHFDLYRIRAVDLFGLGYEEFFYGRGISAVEWSERLEELTPRNFWKVELSHVSEEERDILLSYCGCDPKKGVARKRPTEMAGAYA